MTFASRNKSHSSYARALRTTFLARYGGEVLYAGDGSTTLVGEDGKAGDAVLHVRCPCPGAVTKSVADPEYRQVTRLRTEPRTEAVLQATASWT